MIEAIGGEKGWYSLPVAWQPARPPRPARRRRGTAPRTSRSPAAPGGRLRRLLAGGGGRARTPAAPARGDAPARSRLAGTAGAQARGETVYGQRAIFHPRGLAGHLYWWSLTPFHSLIFGRMLRNVAATAERDELSSPGRGPGVPRADSAEVRGARGHGSLLGDGRPVRQPARGVLVTGLPRCRIAGMAGHPASPFAPPRPHLAPARTCSRWRRTSVPPVAQAAPPAATARGGRGAPRRYALDQRRCGSPSDTPRQPSSAARSRPAPGRSSTSWNAPPVRKEPLSSPVVSPAVRRGLARRAPPTGCRLTDCMPFRLQERGGSPPPLDLTYGAPAPVGSRRRGFADRAVESAGFLVDGVSPGEIWWVPGAVLEAVAGTASKGWHSLS